MPRGLAPKLILSITAIVVIVEGVFAFINVRIQERELLDEAVLRTEQISTLIKGATWHAMLADNRDAAYQMMDQIGKAEGIRKVRIFSKAGENVEIAFSTGDDAGHRVNKTAEACYMCHARGEPIARPETDERVRIFREGDGRLLGMVTPIYNETACSATACHGPNPHPEEIAVLGVLDISVPLDREDRATAGIRLRSFLVALVSVVLIGTFVTLFTRRFVGRPVRRLTEATREMGKLEAGHAVETGSKDEIGGLALAFNEMRERLLEARREVDGFTRTLEEKVEERTKQLEVTQQKLYQTDRLASLGQLAASVAHEINNPLSGVLNFSKLLQRILRDDGIPPDRIEDFRRYLAQISSETARAGRIVSDLLTFSRRSRPDSSDTDLNELVRTTMSVLAHRLEMGDVKYELHLANDVPAIRCDPSRIQQVITNLVLNSAEATTKDGHVVVRTRGSPDGGAILQISDNGIGIPKEHLPRVFDPFFTTKEEGKGIGLGLAVVYGIVENHRGSIEVESEPGRGTTFTIRLPAAPPAAPSEGEE